MREFPKSLYFSASWQDQDRGRTRFVASLFASKGFLLVGDHPDNRNDPEHYPKRVAEILQDCSGFVIFWPKRDTKQTTSPFMFPEPLYAGRSGLPMFVLYEDGVQIDVQHRDGDTLLLFGGADQASPSLDVDELTATGYSDQQVLPAMSIRLSKPPAFVGPIKVPANPDSFEHHKPAILAHSSRQ